MKITRKSSILGIVGPWSRSRHNFEIFLHLPQYKLSGRITNLVQARKLKLSMYVHLIQISNIYEYEYCTSDIYKQIVLSCHARVILRKVGEVHIFKHRLYISALEEPWVVILSKYVLIGVINTIYKHCHA